MKKHELIREALNLATVGMDVTVFTYDQNHANHLYNETGPQVDKEELYRKRPNYFHFFSGGKLTFTPQPASQLETASEGAQKETIMYVLTKASYGDDEWETVL